MVTHALSVANLWNNALIHAVRIPPNVRFEVDDIEQSWTWQPESFDFIFSRDLLFAIRDWPKLIEQSFE